MPAHNPFKTALATRQPQIGLWLSMAESYLAEVAATARYDWLLRKVCINRDSLCLPPIPPTETMPV